MTRTKVVLVAAALLLSTVAVGCGSSGSDGSSSGGKDGTGSDAAETDVGPGTGAELTPRELIDALASAGIGVSERPGGEPVTEVTDPGPMKLVRDQVEVMSRQTIDRSGTVGAQIDGVVGPIEGGPEFSLVIAAYVKAGKTNGAELGRRVMGDQTWEQAENIVFPDVVLALFANDVAREAMASKPAGLVAPAGAESVVGSGLAVPVRGADDATGVCSALAGWVDGIISTIVDALKVDTSDGGLTGLLGDIWNTVVDLAVAAGKAAVGALTAPVLGIVKTALAIAGTISMVASLLRPWSVSAAQKPEPAMYGVEPGGGNPVEIEATVDPGTKDGISAGVADCAKQAGVDVPDPTSAKGSKITWKDYGVTDVGTDISKDDTIDADNTAGFRFVTKTESEEDATKGDPVPHTVAVSIAIDRTQVKDLQKLLTTLLTGSVPSVIAPIVGSVLDLITQPIFESLSEMLGTGGSGTGIVISHTPAKSDDKPDVTTTTGCEGEAGGAIPDGTWTGPVTVSVDGTPTQASGTITTTASGTVTMTVAKGKVTSGTWSMEFNSTGTIVTAGGGTGTIKSMGGSLSGTVGGPATAPVLSGTGTIHGTISVTVQGFSTDAPIDETGPTGATLTVEESTCDEVGGTFIPSFNESTGGQAYFSGTAHWSGTAA